MSFQTTRAYRFHIWKIVLHLYEPSTCTDAKILKTSKETEKQRRGGSEDDKNVGHDVKQLKGQKSQDSMPPVSCLAVAPYFIHIFFLSFFLSFKSVMAAKAVDVMYFSHTLSYLFVLWQFISYHFNFKLEYENRKKIIQVQNDGHGTRIHWTRHVCLYKSIKVHESPFFFFLAFNTLVPIFILNFIHI